MHETNPMARCQCGWVLDTCNICGFRIEENQGRDQPTNGDLIRNSRSNQQASVIKTWPFLGYTLIAFFIGAIIEVIGSTDTCEKESEICWKNGFFAFLGDGVYMISALLYIVFVVLFFSYPFRVAMSQGASHEKKPNKKSRITSNTTKREPRDKMLKGWSKICESCSSEFAVMLKEKELGVIDGLRSIKKMARSSPISKKDWSIGNKPERHFCNNCLKKGDPSDWYCHHCQRMNLNCDCFETSVCTECGAEVAKLHLHGTVCSECHYDYYVSQSPYETY